MFQADCEAARFRWGDKARATKDFVDPKSPATPTSREPGAVPRIGVRADAAPRLFAQEHESVDDPAHLGRKIAGRRKDGFVLVYRLEQSEAAAFDDVQELAQKRLMVGLAQRLVALR